MTSSKPPATRPLPPRPPAVAAEAMDWADPITRQGLEMIAEGLTQLVGFDVAAVSVIREPHELQVMAVAGNDAARASLDGGIVPVGELMRELERADDWGWFKFVPEERRTRKERPWEWVPELDPSDDPCAWRPMDLLVAPLHDVDGKLRGLLSIDCPADGRRPDPARRGVLDPYAAQAARAIMLAVERQQLAEQVRLLSAAREIVRSVSADTLLEGDRIRSVQADLVACFRARSMWVHVFDDGDRSVNTVGDTDQTVPGHVVQLAEAVAVDSWAAQQVRLIGPDDVAQLPGLSAAELADVRSILDGAGVGTVLFAPLGAGRECLGSLVLTRAPLDPEWSDLEIETALEIGRDLGRLVIIARAFDREREAVRELRALDTYKSGLITTLSHELKSPLAAMLGNLELLEDGPDETAPDAEVQAVILAAVGRSATRLTRIVENLLLLARVGDPHAALVAERVDLAEVVAEVRAVTPLAQQHRIVLAVDGPGPVCALGDPAELEILIGNLVGNALKYSAEHDPVVLTLRREDDRARLSCGDVGVGICPQDRDRLFEEFFRSDDADVRGQVGTGLGLAIVDRIVVKHSGRIDIESELGVGTTVHVILPAAG